MYKIQTLNKIAPVGLDLLPLDKYEIASEFKEPDAIILRSFKMHDMELPAALKAVARAGAGTNNIPIDKCTGKGIVVFNTPGANANSVKELVITGMLLAARNIKQALTYTDGLAGKGDEIPNLAEKEKAKFVGTEIRGKRLGVIGLGAIGVLVANAAASLGMEVSGYDPYISVENAWELSHVVKKSRSLEEMLQECDYVTVHVPLSDNTKGMLNGEKFKLAKQGLVLVNFARGGLVNNKDLLEAIEIGKIGTYVTDFPEEELLGNAKVFCLPHLGASTNEAEDNCAVMAAKQLRNYLEFGDIKNSVNFPQCDLPFTSKYRLTIANRNIPNMVGQISTIIASKGINIQDMVNKHREGLAYNIINIDTAPSDDDIEHLKKIDGVLMVRLIEAPATA